MNKESIQGTAKDKEIGDFLKIIARRKNLQKWLLSAGWCLVVSAIIAFILNVAALFIPVYNAALYGWVIMLSGLLISLLYIVIKHCNTYEAARYADSAGLKERLVTSIGLKGTDEGFAGLLKEDTISEIRRFDKKLRLPLIYPWRQYMVFIIILSMSVICMFIPAQSKKDALVLHELAVQAKEVKDKAKEAEKILDKAKDNGIEKAEAKKLGKILEETKKELAEASDKNDIKKAKERLENKLKKELAQAGDTKLAKALQPLVPGTDLEALAGLNKKLEEMKEKGRLDDKLSKEIESVAGSLSKEQAEQLLASLAEAMEDGEITAGEVTEALSDIENREAQMAAATISEASESSGGGTAGQASPQPSATPSAGGGDGSGNGNGGNGNGNGPGSGSGNGNGNGAGSGSGNGNGPGWNTGSTEGIERTGQEGKGEVVCLTGKKQGRDENLTGRKNGDAKNTQKSNEKGEAADGIKADLDAVIGEYSSEAYAKADTNKVPSAMKDIVKEYFSEWGN